MQLALAVAFGGAFGAVVRWRVVEAVSGRLGGSYGVVWGIFSVNVVGSFLAGLVAGALLYGGLGDQSPLWRGFLLTGFLGGFTTFSAFSLDGVRLLERGEFLVAGLYALSSVVVAMLGAFVGLWVMRHLVFAGRL